VQESKARRSLQLLIVVKLFLLRLAQSLELHKRSIGALTNLTQNELVIAGRAEIQFR
jgi:hypothetical protein